MSRCLLLLLPLFLAGLLPFAGNFVVHHPDERHYTDAAIVMLQEGDWLVPRHADGSPRFEKPILTYWIVAGSYALLGISPLASRLPFLLAGCGVLWMTGRLALLLFDRPRVAQLAVLLWFCHPLLMLSSTRCMPDILLCLFLLTSAYGLLALLLGASPRWQLYLAAYGGAGLAVATKGLPVLALLLFTAAFARFNPWQRVPLRRFVHLPCMLLGVLLATGWFFLLDGAQREWALHEFWSDQVVTRLTPHYQRFPRQFAMALGGMALTFFPWILPLAFQRLFRQSSHNTPPSLGVAAPGVLARRFIMFWGLFMALLIGCAYKFADRYLLLVGPFLAILLADVLDRADPELLGQWLKVMLGGVLGLLFVLLIVTTAVDWQLGLTALDALALIGFAVICGGLTCYGWRGGWLITAHCLALALFLILPVGLCAARHFVMPDQGEQIASTLERLGGLLQRPIGFIGKAGLASKVRVCSGGRARLDPLPTPLTEYSLLIVKAELLDGFDASRCEVVPLSEGFADMPRAEVARAIWQGTLPAYLQQHKQQYCLVCR